MCNHKHPQQQQQPEQASSGGGHGHSHSNHGHSHGGHDHGANDHNHGAEQEAHSHGHGQGHFDQNVNKWVARFEGPERLAYSRFPETFALLRSVLLPEQFPAAGQEPLELNLAEVGAGTGVWTLGLAESFKVALERSGAPFRLRVWATEPSQPFVDFMHQKLEALHPGLQGSFQPLLSTYEEPGFVTPEEARVAEGGRRPEDFLSTAEHSLQLIAINNVLHHVEADQAAWLRRLQRWLAPEGLIYIQEFSPAPEKQGSVGPPQHHRLGEQQLDALMAEAGYLPVGGRVEQEARALDALFPYSYNRLYRVGAQAEPAEE